jgi:hypothetical protein
MSSGPDIEFRSNLHSKLQDICFVLLSNKNVHLQIQELLFDTDWQINILIKLLYNMFSQWLTFAL